MHANEIAVTTDVVLFAENRSSILLVRRKNPPFKGQWALPGGFVEKHENLDEAASRELQEETGIAQKKLTQLKAFGAPGRDPRGRTVSIVFFADIPKRVEAVAADDAENAQWFEVADLPALAFDHLEIVEAALNPAK